MSDGILIEFVLLVGNVRGCVRRLCNSPQLVSLTTCSLSWQAGEIPPSSEVMLDNWKNILSLQMFSGAVVFKWSEIELRL